MPAWELITETDRSSTGHRSITLRLPCAGGHVYVVEYWCGDSLVSTSSTFVPRTK